MGKYPFVLRLGMPGDLEIVSELVREAAEWLRTSKNTDQWAKPWPDHARHRERMLNDLLKRQDLARMGRGPPPRPSRWTPTNH